MSSANVWVVIKIKMENSLCTQKCVQCQAGVGARADMIEALFVQLQGSIVSVFFVFCFGFRLLCFRYLLFSKSIAAPETVE